MNALVVMFTTLVASVLVVAMVGVAASQPPFALTQYGASDDRELCLQDCRQWVAPYGWGGRRGGDYYWQYARCVQDCESRFWNEFERKMDRLKEEE